MSLWGSLREREVLVCMWGVKLYAVRFFRIDFSFILCPESVKVFMHISRTTAIKIYTSSSYIASLRAFIHCIEGIRHKRTIIVLSYVFNNNVGEKGEETRRYYFGK